MQEEIIAAINADVKQGIYDNFPKLKDRLLFIATKLAKQIYIVNSNELSSGEKETLVENEYMEREW